MRIADRAVADSARSCATRSGVFYGWAGPLLVTALGAWLRFDHLAAPRALVFDEIYYAPDAFGILRYGAEHNVSSQVSTLILSGNTNIFIRGGEFAAHPPFGKIQIAAGEWLFGLNPFGWRFAAAVAGSLSVLLVARIARRMTGSTLLGCVAGLLLALDGLEFVMSRIAMLDIFVMFWVLAAFGCLVIDRDKSGHTERTVLAPRDEPDPGPGPGVRWWRVAAGACLGLACGSKWNGVFFLFFFTLMCVAWDVTARRGAGPRRPARDGVVTVLSMWLTAAAVYLATWSGWLASTTGWDRNYAAAHGVRVPVISALYSLYEYHTQMLSFGLGLHAAYSPDAGPWTWLALTRPTVFYYATSQFGLNGCPAAGGCVQQVLAVGTPAIWWAAIPALITVAAWWLLRRDWRAAAVLIAVAAGWLPWFALPGRTQYFYYAVSLAPFLILAITLCLRLIIGPPSGSAARLAAGAAVVVVYLLVVEQNFIYLYPVLTGRAISYAAWHARMWLPGWI
jgi:dolichyl-phosphate-mannose-protein mannosyltransferase